MNETLKSILKSIRESNELLQSGATEDAVLLSGETLAEAYEQWSTAFNSGRNTLDEINIMAIASSCHCCALAAMGNHHDAYATSIGAILQISADDNSSENIDQSLLSIYTTAAFSLLNQITRLTPDKGSIEHINCITRYLASMLYYLYNLVGHRNPDSPYLDGAYEALTILREYTTIETVTITVLNDSIDPKAPHKLIGDLVGRSHALNLLSD